MKPLIDGIKLEGKITDSDSTILPYILEVKIPGIETRLIYLDRSDFTNIKRSQEAP